MIRDENYQAETINLQTNNRAIVYSLESIKGRTVGTFTHEHRRRCANTGVQLSCQGKECTGKTLTKCSLRTFPVAKGGKDGNRTLNEYSISQ